MHAPRTIATGFELEIDKILGSRFIGWVAPATCQAEVNQRLETRRALHPNATHHCWAWRGRSDGQVRFSDDGEPRGSAGRRILDVLTGQNVREAVLVVTRYFGGTKLGVGGLGRAYGQSARAVLEPAPLQPWAARRDVTVVLPYAAVPLLDRLLAGWGEGAGDRQYGEQVRVVLSLPEDGWATTVEELRGIAGGRVSIEE